jgi:hypothetical protein
MNVPNVFFMARELAHGQQPHLEPERVVDLDDAPEPLQDVGGAPDPSRDPGDADGHDVEEGHAHPRAHVGALEHDRESGQVVDVAFEHDHASARLPIPPYVGDLGRDHSHRPTQILNAGRGADALKG